MAMVNDLIYASTLVVTAPYQVMDFQGGTTCTTT